MAVQRKNIKTFLVVVLLGVLGGTIMQMGHTGSISLDENLRISLLGYIIFCLSLSAVSIFLRK